MALKESRQERIQIQWDFEPWEARRKKFTEPGKIDKRVDEQLAELGTGEDEEPRILVKRRQCWKSTERRSRLKITSCSHAES